MTAKRMFPLTLLCLLLLVSFASSERDHSHSLSDDRPQEDEYFEQCQPVNVWSEQLGHVSVLAFLDLTWQYSIRQAVMLKLLSSRLRKSGFSDIRFFAITPPSGELKEDSTEDMEIEAWGEIARMYKVQEDPASATDLPPREEDETEMVYLRDDARSRMWQRFRASKDQVVVIDRCGRLTYQVIIPWSILYFPYVKAAILSAYEDDPCDGCDPSVYEAYFSSAVNNTDKEVADPRSEMTDDDADVLIWRTAGAGNLTMDSNESSESDRVTSTPAVALEGATDGTGDDGDFLSASAGTTESAAAYQYDDNRATEFSVDENNGAEGARNREETESVATTISMNLELQQDVPPKQEEIACTHDDATPDYVETDENNSTITARTTTADDDGNANVNTDGPDKHGQNESVDANVASKDDLLERDPLPLRIIMQAPHLHGGSGRKKTKKHTHLILKVGDPTFHGHLSSEIEIVKPSTNSWQDASIEAKSAEEQETVGTDAVEDNDWIYTFDVDESPGIYGEVADYWKTEEDNNDISDENKTYKSTIKYNEETREDKTVSPETTRVNNQEGETKIRNKLVEHYSKLLPWILYRLNK